MKTKQNNEQNHEHAQKYGLKDSQANHWRIISLSRSITDILVALDTAPLNLHWWQIDLDGAEIAEHKPELILCGPDSLPAANDARKMMVQAGQKAPLIIACQTDSLGSGIGTIRKLGHLLGREEKAWEIVKRENGYLKIAKAKAKAGGNVSNGKAPECLVLLDLQSKAGNGQISGLLVCGAGSLQGQIVGMAGGDLPEIARAGSQKKSVWITPEELVDLAPDFIFATNAKCLGSLAEFQKEGRPEKIPAFAKGRIMSFPAEMLGHFSCTYGYISLWLASTLYPDIFADKKGLLKPDTVVARHGIDLPKELGIRAELAEARLYDLPSRTILLRAEQPRQILSSLHGWRNVISWIGNHECPHPSWPLLAKMGMEETNRRVLALHGLKAADTCLLHTGADISKFALKTLQSGHFTVTALATAGVLFNALRAGSDSGNFVEPGTINLILLANTSLSKECLVQCLVQATEAKVAALQSLDIRSCQSGLQATGTGTDNCIVVSGTGRRAKMAGGHTRLGELVAKASYEAVREAVCQQHQLGPGRPLPQRLAERGNFWQAKTCRELEKSAAGQAVISAFLALQDAERHGLVAEWKLLLEWMANLTGRESETIPEAIRNYLMLH